jgi:conjugative transfer region protein TrbK
MRGQPLNVPAVARALGFALVAIAMVIAALHFHAPTSRIQPHHKNSSAAADPLADELQRCQLIASQAKDDAACEAAWAENRRRFFTDAPAPATHPAGARR